MPRFATLGEIGERDRRRVGGKAFNCARLRQGGFPVPDGIAVPGDADDATIRSIANDPWMASHADGLFAVRSSGIDEDSAGDSFAGVHETQLNVARADVGDAVIACRRSAQSAEARSYREARHLHDADAIGVLVQRMVTAAWSGVAFTIDPVGGGDEIVIEAAPGLGDALVSGRIDPDQYRVSKRDGAVRWARTGSQADANGDPLTRGDIATLAALVSRIERFFGTPQDIEWCFDGRAFWIVQSRPITAIAGQSAPRGSIADGVDSGTRRALPDVEWTRANLSEVLPDQVSPQALEFYERLLDEGERRFFGRLIAPTSELGPIIKAFHGRLYFNVGQLRYVAETVGAAVADTLRTLGHPEAIHPEDEIAHRPPLGRLVRALPDLARLVVNDARAATIFREHEQMVDAAVARLSAVDPRTQSDQAVWDTIEWSFSLVPKTLVAVFVMTTVQRRQDMLRAICKRVGFPFDRLLYPQLAAGEPSVSTQQALDVLALADVARADPAAAEYLQRDPGTFVGYRDALAGTPFLRALDRFLALYGHRGRFESDWALPRLREDPAPLLFAVRGQLSGERQQAASIAAEREREAARAWREFTERLSRWQRWTVLPRARSLVRRLKQQYLWREKVRSDATRVVAALRAWHLALGERFAERGWIERRDDYFLLQLDEVRQAIRDPSTGPQLREIAARRAAQLAVERDLVMPLLMRERDLPRLLAQPSHAPLATDAELAGLCVSPGCVEGEVVVLRDPGEFAKMKRGAILVAPATDPSWTPLFTLAAGVVVEVGGILSHASTIAREYGLPALANVKDATRVLQTGTRVRLDASGGRVVPL